MIDQKNEAEAACLSREIKIILAYVIKHRQDLVPRHPGDRLNEIDQYEDTAQARPASLSWQFLTFPLLFFSSYFSVFLLLL